MEPSLHSPEQQLASFIAKFTPEVASLTHSILAKMRARYPTALELVYDNYNALAIGFGATERSSQAIFSIVVFPKWVSLFFLKGKDLPDPDKLLQGHGKVVRHIRLPSAATLDELSVKKNDAGSDGESGGSLRWARCSSHHHQIDFRQAAAAPSRGRYTCAYPRSRQGREEKAMNRTRPGISCGACRRWRSSCGFP